MIKESSLLHLKEAAFLLQKGELVVMPTETVYGLAGDATNDHAVSKIFQLKNRPHFNPLIIHVLDQNQAEEIAVFTSMARNVASAFWPGPLTLVLPLRQPSAISLLATNGLPTVALRVPSHPVAQDLLNLVDRPLAAPSANKSMEISPTSALDPQKSFGKNSPLILEGGDCPVGIESTIIDFSENRPTVLRFGGIAIEDLEAIIGSIEKGNINQSIKAPGMMKRHYAPTKPLRLNVITPLENEIYIGFGVHNQGPLNLSIQGDLVEAAANLFRMLRQADYMKGTQIAVAPIPFIGLGLAINDRIKRAAAL